MKITCEYCGNTFNDTEDKCPSCGSPNAGVIRSASKEPKTIEELKAWYKSKGLPPAETTRFFIGENYKKPRAFGIFKDETSGIVTVYKNKDNGERAIRYQGKDEAYAVNELLQRLKQEITQQKMNNAKKASSNTSKSNTGGSSSSGIKGLLSSLSGLLIFGLLCVVAMFAFIMILGTVITVVENEPDKGYYTYNSTTYYYNDSDYRGVDGLNWYQYDTAQKEWLYPVIKDRVAEELRKKKNAKSYFVTDSWDESLGCSDYNDSVYAKDIAFGSMTKEGYYKYGDMVYYHMNTDNDNGWYYYDDDSWSSINYSALPEDFNHSSQVEDFYYTSEWDSSTQVTDFTETEDYQYAKEEWNDDDDSDYSWDSSDSWDSDSSDWGSDW